MKERQLSKFFILELFAICLKRKSVLEVANSHLQYHFLPSKEYKEIWKSISNHYKLTGELITLGILSQQFRESNDIMDILGRVSEVDPPDETIMIDQIEIFIKKMIFIDAHRELAERYNKQDDEGAFQLMTETAEKLSEFKLLPDNHFNNIIGGIHDRISDRKERSLASLSNKKRDRKIPTGIQLEVDNQIHGGVDRGDTLLWMGVSGGGKSKAIKYSGYYNSKLGNRVVHIQAEGTLQEALDLYDAAYVGQPVEELETGMLDEKTQTELNIAINQLKQKGGEIHIKAFEQFGIASLLDVKAFMDLVVKKFGPIDLLLLDYLELVDPGDGKYYKEERYRREAIANGFKNLCKEFDCAGITATQAMDISHAALNDSKFVLRREHISEFKGMVKPFSYFLTINATDQEIEKDLRRLHWDKCRKYKIQKRTFTIATNFNNERFYDNIQTQLLARYGTKSD